MEHHQHAHHDKHAGHDPEQFRRRFWASLVLTVPVIASYAFSVPGEEVIAPALGTVVLLWGGRPFLEGAVAEVRNRQPGMMLLVATAITVAFLASSATTLGWFELEFWWELSALVTVMLLGHWQEMKAIGQARGALTALAELLPDHAERITGDGTETVPLHHLQPGDTVLVRPGGRVPADGIVVDGEAELDESMVTGESRPVAKATGDRVVAGTVATDSSLRVRVAKVGDDTALAGIQRLVAQAQASRSRAQVLADRAAALLFYLALGAAVATFVTWMLLGRPEEAVTRAVTVLVIACPHALGLAIPLVVSLSTALSARAGILVKDRLALERMRHVDAVLFDKTGTLTRGRHVVTKVLGDDDTLRLAAAVEADSEHPLAKAIVAAAPPDILTAQGFRATAGRGVEARVDGSTVAVGGPALLRERNLTPPPELAEADLHVVRDGRVVGGFRLEDEIRSESKEAVDELHRVGVRVVMITGDARKVAHSVADALGIDEVFAEVLPEDKDRIVAELQTRGLRVAMVGDGVNDAPALARADVGIAIGAGTDVAIESAGVVLATSDPRAVLGVIRLSRASYRKMVQNLGWAAGYNVVAVPLAAGALAWAGVTLPPAVGALLMSLSTVVVALNAQLLRRVDLRAERPTPGRAAPSPRRRLRRTGTTGSRRTGAALRLGRAAATASGTTKGRPAR
ncbi:MAG: cadmium-translocating P-type ATPase [Actinomycetota bacterium]|nr:cadmium-translocating P-type ATPase [Actinomycetota bacterium]